MRKLILAMLVSLDGYIEGPNHEFVPPAWSGDLDRYWARGNIDGAGTLLYGRRAYEMNAGYWPKAASPGGPAGQVEFATRMNAMPKIVFSRTLTTGAWNNTRVVKDDIAGEIGRLKQEPGKDLVMLGGADIASAVMALGFVDEYRLLLAPTILGGGNPLFREGGERLGLKLLDAKQLDTGAVVLRYEPAKRG